MISKHRAKQWHPGLRKTDAAIMDEGQERDPGMAQFALASLDEAALRACLTGDGLAVRTGPFTVNIRSDLPEIAGGLAQLYGNHPLAAPADFVDFHVAVQPPFGPRRWYRPKISFLFDGIAPFKPLPRDQALPALEWGLNWAIANNAHRYLIVHAAALARDDKAVIMPGPQGAGKSTLCAALANRGWRLLSDELTLIDTESLALHGLARPINLKNESIEIIRNFASDAVLSRPAHDTVKGTVSLLKPPAESVAAMARDARAHWIVVPDYARGAAAQLVAVSPARTFIELGHNAFNYSILGRAGFQVLAEIVDASQCFRFRYSALDDAVATFERLAGGKTAGADHHG